MTTQLRRIPAIPIASPANRTTGAPAKAPKKNNARPTGAPRDASTKYASLVEVTTSSGVTRRHGGADTLVMMPRRIGGVTRSVAAVGSRGHRNTSLNS